MNTSYRRTALALALCALTGAAFAQSSSPSSGGGQSSPSTTSPMNSGTGSGNPPSSSPSGQMSPSTPGQMSPGGQPMSNGMSNGMRSPSRTDSADNAYKSLDSSNRGYLQRGDVQSLSGFNFDQADTNRDGRLTKDEFSKAWAVTK